MRTFYAFDESVSWAPGSWLITEAAWPASASDPVTQACDRFGINPELWAVAMRASQRRSAGERWRWDRRPDDRN